MNARITRPRPTTLGWTAIALTPTLIVVGVMQSAPAIAGVGCFLLVVVPGAFIACWRNLRGIRFHRQLSPNCFVANPTTATITVTAERGPAIAVKVRDEALGDAIALETNRATAIRPRKSEPTVLSLDRSDSHTIALATTFRKRGIYADFDYQLSSTYPFGLFRKVVGGSQSSPTTVYPLPLSPGDDAALMIDYLSSGSIGSSSSNGSDGDFRSIREYRHGDPLKFVHWPLSLRHRAVTGPESLGQPNYQLVVREFEPPAPSRRLVVFHDYAPRDKHFSQADGETALELLTGVLVTLSRTGIPFEFVAPFTKWKPIEIAGPSPELHQLLEQLATIRLGGKLKAKELARRLAELPQDGARLIVLGAADAATWEDLVPENPGNRCLDPLSPMRRLPPMEIAV